MAEQRQSERAKRRRRAFSLLLVATLVVFAWFVWRAPRLITGAAPWGMTSLQTSFTAERAGAVLNSWIARGRDTRSRGRLTEALLQLLVDMLFIPLYAATLTMACGLAASSVTDSDLAGIAVWAAALLDVVENGALGAMVVMNQATPALAGTAGSCFTLKLLLLGSVAVWLLRQWRRA